MEPLGDSDKQIVLLVEHAWKPFVVGACKGACTLNHFNCVHFLFGASCCWGIVLNSLI